MIDNYDSFTYNVVQYLGELGSDVKVVRNDMISIKDIEVIEPEKIVSNLTALVEVQAGLKPVQHSKGTSEMVSFFRFVTFFHLDKVHIATHGAKELIKKDHD